MARGEAIMVPDGYTNLDELEQKLKDFSIRLTKDECLDIPEKIYQKREVMISGDQKRVYQRLKIEALAKFENETISVHNQLTEILDCIKSQMVIVKVMMVKYCNLIMKN